MLLHHYRTRAHCAATNAGTDKQRERRHPQVEQDHVGPLAQGRPDRLPAVDGLQDMAAFHLPYDVCERDLLAVEVLFRAFGRIQDVYADVGPKPPDFRIIVS